MNLRQIKHRTYKMMTNPSYEHLFPAHDEDSRDVMWHIRAVKPCRTYHAWCPDCNAALFPRLFGRFPYTRSEMHQFEQAQQAKEGVQ
jgi:hypothetical protein